MPIKNLKIENNSVSGIVDDSDASTILLASIVDINQTIVGILYWDGTEGVKNVNIELLTAVGTYWFKGEESPLNYSKNKPFWGEYKNVTVGTKLPINLKTPNNEVGQTNITQAAVIAIDSIRQIAFDANISRNTLNEWGILIKCDPQGKLI